jgi:nucleotide-binding universal stress UspA family protein
MKNIVALVDFSDLTIRIAEQASQLAKAFQGKLVLLHVVPEQPAVVELGLASPTVMQPPSEKKVEAHLNRLLTLRDSLIASGVNVVVQQLEGVGVGKVLEQCRTLETDLIILGTHHHSALYHLFVGSFTSDVLKSATCPVMVVPSPAHGQA